MTNEISTLGKDDHIEQLGRIVDDLWEEVRQLRRECDERRRNGNLPAITNQELATAVGVASDSTIGYWFDKRRPVPDQLPFMKLIKALDGEERVWRPRWRKAKDAYDELRRLRPPRQKADRPTVGQMKAGSEPTNHEPQADDHRPKDATSAPPPPRSAQQSSRRHPSTKTLIVAGFVVLGLMIVIILVVALQPDAAPKLWYTKITGTENMQGQDVGTYGYTNPRTSEKRGPGYMGGETVAVVCQERHGRQVSDSTLGRTSTVWNKLSDGNWVSDLYTDLPKADGDTPPLGIPACP